MPDNKKRPIIIKRVSDSGESGHHGGAWKIAYADFMTAMMAFFLVMWLLNATTEEQRKGIAQFFNPMAEKDTRLGSSNGMLETSPSPLTAGTTLHKVKDGDAPDDDGGEQPGARDAARRSEEGGSPDNITRGLKAHLTPASPAIIPVGGPESGGGKSIGTIGVDNPVAAAAEQSKIDNMVQGLEQSVAQNPDTQDAAKNMSVSFGRDDIRIELRDANNTPMFDTASATPNAAGRKMLEQIGAWLAPMPEQLSIVGYTDADQYRATKHGNGMSNWTLSAQRADGAREVLVRAGYPDRNILSVSGRADRDLAVPADPDSAANRRVVLILHRRFTNPDPAGGAIVPLPASGGAQPPQAPVGGAQPPTPPAAGAAPAQPAAPAAPTPAAQQPAQPPAQQPAQPQSQPAPTPAPVAPARRTRGVRVRAATRPGTAPVATPQAPADQPFQPSQDTWTPAPQ